MNATKGHVRGLNGPEGLVCAIINTTVDDATGRAGVDLLFDAWEFLAGPSWRHHIEVVGLPHDAWPAALDNAPAMIRVIDMALGEDRE